jgi:hypothetical protein
MTLPLRPVFVAGLAMGIAGNFLLRGAGGPGLNFFLLFAGLGLAVGMLGRRSGLAFSREASITLAAGVAFAGALALRASEALQILALFAAAVAFALPALRAGAAWLKHSGVSDVIEAVAGAAANAMLGAFRLVGAALGMGSSARSPAEGGPMGSAPHPAWAVLRGLLLAVPFLIVFGALFISADRVFADLVQGLFRVDFEEILSHVFVTAALTWLACGYLTGFLTGTRPVDLPGGFRRRPPFGIVEIGVALAMIDLLFALFVWVQFRHLFGGSGLVEVTPGLTYAEYVREGFGQLALACALVLPSLLAADWILGPEDEPGAETDVGAEGGRSRRDAWTFRALGGVLLLLLAVIIASAFQRVGIYEEAYGLTESRFYGAVFLGWLTLLGVWFAATVLRGLRERFTFPALVSGFALVALLLAANPDAWIARNNLARADAAPVAAGGTSPGGGVDRPGGQPAMDADYLASLGADAVPALMAALPGLPPQPRCVIARGLLERWGPEEAADFDWRSWNRSVARAREMVGQQAEVLRSMVGAPVEDGCQPS